MLIFNIVRRGHRRYGYISYIKVISNTLPVKVLKLFRKKRGEKKKTSMKICVNFIQIIIISDW